VTLTLVPATKSKFRSAVWTTAPSVLEEMAAVVLPWKLNLKAPPEVDGGKLFC
jgi:hypothetical protein